jgi:hypothetical protein
MPQRVGERVDRSDLMLHGVARGFVLGEEERELLPTQVVEPLPEATEEQRRREFAIP